MTAFCSSLESSAIRRVSYSAQPTGNRLVNRDYPQALPGVLEITNRPAQRSSIYASRTASGDERGARLRISKLGCDPGGGRVPQLIREVGARLTHQQLHES